jgi:hypothetical protein
MCMTWPPLMDSKGGWHGRTGDCHAGNLWEPGGEIPRATRPRPTERLPAAWVRYCPTMTTAV